MSCDLAPHLEWLAARLDPAAARAAEELQRRACACEPLERLPLIVGAIDDMSKQGQPWPGWPVVPYGEAFRDPTAMLLSELRWAHESVVAGDDRVITVRPNYGVGVIPSALGCEVVQQGDDLPWTRPLPRPALLRALSAGVPRPRDLAARAAETIAYFRQALAPYPSLSQAIRIGIADNQGPFNLAAEIIGSDIYALALDEPHLVRDTLELVTETYVALTRAYKAGAAEPADVAYNFQCRLPGATRICEDNALCISPRMYEELCAPYNARALAALGGGTLLVCGEPGPHLAAMAATPGVRAFIYWHERREAFIPAWDIARRRQQALIWYGPLPPEARPATGVIIKRQAASPAQARAIAAARA